MFFTSPPKPPASRPQPDGLRDLGHAPRDPAGPAHTSTVHPCRHTRPDLTVLSLSPPQAHGAGSKPKQVPGVVRGTRGCVGPPRAAPGAGNGPGAGGSGCVTGGSEALSGGEEKPTAPPPPTPPGPAGGGQPGGPRQMDGVAIPSPSMGPRRGSMRVPVGRGTQLQQSQGHPESMAPLPGPPSHLHPLSQAAWGHSTCPNHAAVDTPARQGTVPCTQATVPQRGRDGLALACPTLGSYPKSGDMG